jgi:hypothetical protein
MGIRFSCHSCGKPLNIKKELAGRRGVCPECRARFRIPTSDTAFSSPIETAVGSLVAGTEGQRSSAKEDVQQGSKGTSADAVAQPTSEREQPSPVEAPEIDGGGKQVDSGTIDWLVQDASATWYVRPPSGGQYGPADGQMLKSWIDEGRVANTALLWRDGWPQWREAAEALPEIADQLPGLAPQEQPTAGAGDSPRETPGGVEFSDGSLPASRVFGDNALGDSANPQDRQLRQPQSSAVSGDARMGATRRHRKSRRMTIAAILAVVAMVLVMVLVVVASSGGGGE